MVKMLSAPTHGAFVLSKVELGMGIAEFRLQDLNKAQDKDAVIERRPILRLVVQIARVTGR